MCINRNLAMAALLCSSLTALCAGKAEKGGIDPMDTCNVVWTTPSKDHNGSMPIGNGDIGMNVWVEQNGDLLLLLSKTDAWSENCRLLKLGRVRVKISPSPFEDGAPFEQTLRLRQGEITISAGKAEKAVTLRIWIDANRPVIRVEANSSSPFQVQAMLEVWRTKQRQLTGGELHSAYGLAEAPFPVYEYADTVVGDRKNRIAWYHRNEKSIWEDNLKQQGMADFITKSNDPLMYRTFGACIEGDGLVGESPTSLKSSAPQKSVVISIYPLCSQTKTSDEWLKQLDQNMSRNPALDIEKDRTAHSAWWNEFWNRSWIHAEQNTPATISLLSANGHNVKFGMDQDGGNKFLGKIGRASVITKNLSDEEIRNLFKTGKDEKASTTKDFIYSGTPELYQEIQNTDGLNDKNGLTLEAWIIPGKLPGGGARIIDKTTPGTDNGFLLDTCPGNSLRLLTKAGTLNVKNVLPADTWSHVAAVINSREGKIKLYLNGEV
ncbi:MAG: DUF5703 domain-containing protein, partial [Victivallales bacterium]